MPLLRCGASSTIEAHRWHFYIDIFLESMKPTVIAYECKTIIFSITILAFIIITTFIFKWHQQHSYASIVKLWYRYNPKILISMLLIDHMSGFFSFSIDYNYDNIFCKIQIGIVYNFHLFGHTYLHGKVGIDM